MAAGLLTWGQRSATDPEGTAEGNGRTSAVMTFPRRCSVVHRAAFAALVVLFFPPDDVLSQSAAELPQDARASVFEGYSNDPRAVSTYLSVLSWDAPWLETRIAAFGVGDAFTINRRTTEYLDVELAFDFVIHSQFDLDAPSFEFVNADFIVSLPLDVRSGAWSGRARFGHWSAHLGDEYLLRTGRLREETSVEFLEIFAARDVGPLRLVVGGERRLRIVPRGMPRNLLHLGADIRRGPALSVGRLGTARWTAATDLRWDASTRGPAVSLKGGLEIEPRRTEPGYRTWSIQFEFFDGPSPFGQYFREPLRTIGISFRLR
jgi:hypothetical protein